MDYNARGKSEHPDWKIKTQTISAGFSHGDIYISED